MDIDRKNKKLGIKRSLSSKQRNVDVDFVKIAFFIKLMAEIRIKKIMYLIDLSYCIYYNISTVYQAKCNCIKAFLKIYNF